MASHDPIPIPLGYRGHHTALGYTIYFSREGPPNRFPQVSFSGSDSALIRGLRSAFLSLIGTQTVPGSLQFGFRSTSRSPYCFLSIVEGTSQGLPQKSNRLLAGGASQWPPQILILSRALSLRLYPSLSNHLPPNHHSVISCSFAAPFGLGSFGLLSFCRSWWSQLSCPSAAPVGLNSIPP
ncbi:hypothetical protein TNCV_2216451 [Trichonephila clavipes]|nr:hypothetical protein TNCV_2216451 [Trichonephila clavipes]